MKYLFIVLTIVMVATSCRNDTPHQYANDSELVEAVEVEPEVILLPVDTTNIKGKWQLVKYHSPIFNIEPTGKFDYILEVSGGGFEIKFHANRLLAEYTLKGDTISVGNAVITQAKGSDEPVETAICGLLLDRGIKKISVYKFPLYLTILGDHGEYADFQKIDD